MPGTNPSAFYPLVKFADIIGLQELKQTLVQAVQQQHVAHAQLFLGAEGRAHLPLALAYATYVNCTNKQADDACGECPSCRKYGKLIHPDLHFVFPTATTKDVPKRTDAISERFLPAWREFVLEQPYGNLRDWSAAFGAENKQAMIPREESRSIVRALSLKALDEGYKVMLIWLPELMQAPAANAILKILEEPPAKTLFLLVAEDASALLPTILSRTQIVQVRAFSDQEVAAYLQQHLGCRPEQAAQVAFLSEGNLREALRLAQEVEHESEQFFRDWMRTCFKADFTEMIRTADRFDQLGKEGQKGLLQYALNAFREALVFRYGDRALLRAQGESLQFIGNFSKVLHERNLPLLAQAFSDAYAHIERNANAKITSMHLSITSARLFAVKEA